MAGKPRKAANSKNASSSSASSRNAGSKKVGSDNDPERLSSDDVRTALIDGLLFRNKGVQYAAVNGLALFEGDILLGPVDEVEAATAARRTGNFDATGFTEGVVVTGSQFRWPNARVPYDIDAAMPNQGRVTDAIAHWEQKTAIRFVLRTTANASTYPNYVHFFAGNGCYSRVGMQGNGKQDISLASGCGLGSTIHEIGHAVGLWHEQSREDRDSFVTINWANITAGKEHNFNQHIADGDDVGAYDYGSIMHYPRTAFSKNGNDTIVPTNPSTASIGQRSELSAGDIAAVANMYGQPAKAPWRDHVGNVKKVVDDPPVAFKKVRDDAVPNVKKVRDDAIGINVKKVRDDAIGINVKKVRDDVVVRPPFGRIPQFAWQRDPGLSPFLLATPHHAALGQHAGAEAEMDALVAAIDSQLAAGAAAVEEATRNVIALQAALTAATAELAAAQQAFSEAVLQAQALGSG